MSTVTIEEVDDDTPVDIDGNSGKKRKRNVTLFEKTMMSLKQPYESIEKKRVAQDFMFMMISGKDMVKKRHHIHVLIDVLKKTYPHVNTEEGFTPIHLDILDRIERSGDQDCYDTLWFFMLAELPSLLHWMIHGDGNSDPPALGNKEWFLYFLRSDSFLELCNSLLDSKIEVDVFAMAVRAESFMTQGPVDIKHLVVQEEMSHQITQGDNNNV